ncbi:MAG: Veg family protein [Coriobacteriales bacterium]|jgi:uncharacterized protein Veg|nr:Veg family protein [Coriobacteriales bacterium]
MELSEKEKLIGTIQKKLIDCTGSRLRVRANLGRSRIIECEGIVKQAHSAHFLMELEKKRGCISKQSYQYADVLTGTVELSDADSREALFPFLEEVV